MSTKIYTSSCLNCKHKHIHKHTSIHKHTYIHKHTCIVYTQTYTHSYTKKHIYIYVHIHKHTCTHKHIHNIYTTYTQTGCLNCKYIHNPHTSRLFKMVYPEKQSKQSMLKSISNKKKLMCMSVHKL